MEEVPGVRSVAVVSSDGLLLLSSDPGRAADGAARPGTDGPQGIQRRPGHHRLRARQSHNRCREADGRRGVKQTMVAMDEGSVFVMSISDGSLLGVHATPDCDMSVIAYHMALFVGRAGHVLTPELRSELRKSMESVQ